MLRMREAAISVAPVPAKGVDAVVAATVAGLWLATAAGSPSDAFAAAPVIATGAALVVRRRFPLGVMAATAALLGWYQAADYRPGLGAAGMLVALFTVAAGRGRGWTVLSAAASFAVLVAGSGHGPLLRSCLVSAAWVAAVAIVGDGSRRLTESLALLDEYQDQVKRKHRDREQRAVLLERIRIARELHDVTAHHLSVIAVQAGVARFVFDKEPETADRALRAISEVGSEGLAELRRLISLLRPEEDESSRTQTSDPPAPGVAQLPVLIERVGLSGTPSRYTVAGLQRPLPAGIELCVYRVVQESLTNVLKHAPGSSVEVRLEYGLDHVRVTVTDTGPHAVPAQRSRIPASAVTQAARHSGSGVGLTGMRERAALYGGELSAGRNRSGGFEVSLTVPVDAVEGDESEAAVSAGEAVFG